MTPNILPFYQDVLKLYLLMTTLLQSIKKFLRELYGFSSTLGKQGPTTMLAYQVKHLKK